MLLPVVSPDTGHSISHYLGKYDNAGSDKVVIRKELKAIEEENPAIAEFIERWCSKEGKNKKNLVHSALCGILVYRLLRSQAEADQMKLEFKFQ